MAEANVAIATSATGTFAVLRPAPMVAQQTGKTGPAGGSKLPAATQQRMDIEELARALNVASQSIGRDLRFEVDMESGRSVIQVLDRDTGEVIRQIPPEKTDIFLAENGAVRLRLYSNRV